MAKKCYAIRKGHRTGIFDSWDECKLYINGFSGAEYRGFGTREEAEAYLRGEETGISSKTGSRVVIEKPVDDLSVNIYTDGSFKDGDIAVGLYLEGLKSNPKFYGVVNCYEYASIANIAGEILAVLLGVELAIQIGFTNINIIYDYDGVEYWYNGTWKAKGQLQSIYATMLNTLRLNNNLNISFTNVKGHSGINGNVIADKMATRGRNFKNYISLDSILRGTVKLTDVPLYYGL